MTANTAPIFSLTPVIGMVNIASANTARDGTGDVGVVITGATDGTRVTRITVKATVTTTAGMVRLYVVTDGDVFFLWREISVAAYTVSATVQSFVYSMELIGESALVLPSGYYLAASTHNAESFNVIAEGGNY